MPINSIDTIEITMAKRKLDSAREHGDELQIDLAEGALNDLLDRLDVTLVTCNKKGEL
jgi:hypothetical protein